MDNEFLQRVETALKRSQLPATGFGMRAIGDPNLIRDLRRGRECRSATRAAIETFLEKIERGEAA